LARRKAVFAALMASRATLSPPFMAAIRSLETLSVSDIIKVLNCSVTDKINNVKIQDTIQI
jgi:hypothetical protein